MGWLDTVVEWVVNLMETIGGPGVALAIFLENVFPPIPSEVILPLAGFTAATPNAPYNIVGAVLWATLGSVLGAFLLYYLGVVVGLTRLRKWADAMPLVYAEDVDAAVNWFNRHGRSAIFFGRLVPGVRSLISIPAGVDRMPLVSFGLFTALGSLLWNTVLVIAGYVLQDNWHVVTDFMDKFSTVVYVLLVLILVYVLFRLIRRSVKRRGEPGPAAQVESQGDDS